MSRTRVRVVAVLVVLTFAVGLAPDAGAVRNGRVAIGDSIMRAAKWHLQSRGFAVDARIGRQVHDGISVLRTKKRTGSLRKQVVVHLGTNGTFRSTQCRVMHRMVGQRRTLFLLTIKAPRSWRAKNNDVIRRCAKRYSNVYLVDWKRYVCRHQGLVARDGYHLTPKGARSYAALVDRAVDRIGRR